MPTKEPPKKVTIPKLVRFQGDLVEEVLHVSAKSLFKRLILETPLWSYSMSSSLKSQKASKCKKGKSGVRPPIPYVPPTDLIEKQDSKQIKVKMPDGTNFSIAAFTSGANKDYFVHVIAVLCIIKKKEWRQKSRRPGWQSVTSGRKWRLISSSHPTNLKKPRHSATPPLTSSRTFSRQRKSLQLR